MEWFLYDRNLCRERFKQGNVYSSSMVREQECAFLFPFLTKAVFGRFLIITVSFLVSLKKFRSCYEVFSLTLHIRLPGKVYLVSTTVGKIENSLMPANSPKNELHPSWKGIFTDKIKFEKMLPLESNAN